jgi:hypothetical protein
VLERTPLRSYDPPLNMGNWPIPVLADWARATQVWRGVWSLVAMALALLLALVLRSRALLLFSGLALGQVVVAAVAQRPWVGAFEPVVAPFFLALLLAPAVCVERIREKRRQDQDAESPSEPFEPFDPEGGEPPADPPLPT